MDVSKILDDIYHVETPELPPPLFSRLLETLVLFQGGGLNPTQVNAEYETVHTLYSDIKNSYSFDPTLFRTVIIDNINTLNGLSLGVTDFSKGLDLLLLLVDKYTFFLTMSSQTEYLKKRIEATKEPYSSFSFNLRSGYIVPDYTLTEVIFTYPEDLDETDENIFSSILGSLSPSDFYHPLRDLYLEQIEAKKTNTSTDVILAALNILIPQFQGFIDDFINKAIDFDTGISTRISPSGRDLDYDSFRDADKLLHDPDTLNELFETLQMETYVFNNFIQNSGVDDESLRDEPNEKNLELIQTVNSLIALLNQFELFHEMSVTYLEVEDEKATLEALTLVQDGYNTTMGVETTNAGSGGTINEGYLLNLGSNIDKNTSKINDSAARLDSLGQRTVRIGNSQQDISFFSKDTSSRFGVSLQNKQGVMSSLTTLTSGSLLATASSLTDAYSKLVSSKTSVVALAVAISLANNPSETVKSFFNLLAAPLEAVMLAVNAAICTVKAAQCLLCAVKDGIEKGIKAIQNLISKAADFFNRDSDLLDKITDLKNKILGKANSVIQGSVCSDVQGKRVEDQDGVRAALEGTGLSDTYPTFALTDKVNIFNDVVGGSCPSFFSNMSNSTKNLIKNEFDGMVDELKASVDNVINNLYSLTTCTGCEAPSLKFDLPKLPKFGISFPNFVIKIPYLDSKVIKC